MASQHDTKEEATVSSFSASNHVQPYPGYFPLGAFIVKGPKAIGPIVKRLRETNRLKHGENVTPFFFDIDASTGGHADETNTISGDKLQVADADAEKEEDAINNSTPSDTLDRNDHEACFSSLTIRIAEEGRCSKEEALDKRPATRLVEKGGRKGNGEHDASVFLLGSFSEHKVTTFGISSPVAIEEEWRTAAVRVKAAEADAGNNTSSTASTSKSGDQYFAVHATGFWSESDFRDLFECTRTPSSKIAATPSSCLDNTLVYVHQLRTLSAACYKTTRAAMEEKGLQSSTHTSSTSSSSPLFIKRQAFETLLSQKREEGCREHVLEDKAKAAKFTFSELFGGIGMFRLGLERAGGRAMFGVEWAAPARMVYERNFGSTDLPFNSASAAVHSVNVNGDQTATEIEKDDKSRQEAAGSATCTYGNIRPTAFACDITEIPTASFPHHDLLTAGFPCQSFAKAGPQQGLVGNAKGWLFYEVVRVLVGSRPKGFLLENVANLVDVEEGDQLEEILRCLRSPQKAFSDALGGERLANTNIGGEEEKRDSSLEYDVSYRVLDGALATPQTRKRVYFIGVLRNPTADAHASERRIQKIFDEAVASHIPAARARQHPFNTFKSVKDVLSGDNSQEAKLVLTEAQRESVSRSKTFRQNPLWRVADLEGNARTVMGSYRTSYQLYSEFVPVFSSCTRPNHATLSAASAPPLTADRHHLVKVEDVLSFVGCAGSGGDGRSVDCAEKVELPTSDTGEKDDASFISAPILIGRCTSSVVGTPPAAAANAALKLRFYSLREVARLQGIPDSYVFEGSSIKGITEGSMYKLVGNAVNPIVIEGLGRAVLSSGLLM